MATPEQLLESGRQMTQFVLGSIDNNLTRSLQIQQSVSNAEVGLMFKGLQFAEQKRMNDASLIQMNNQNEISARRYELESQLAPLQLETQRLQVENQRQQLLQTKTAQDLTLFKGITQPYDTAMASRFAATESPEYMREYLGIKATWMGKVAQGQQFDNVGFENELNQLNNKYKDVKPPDASTTTWNPEVSHMLGQIDPNTQRIYEQRNPLYTKNANALAVSYVTSTDSNVAGIIDKYGSMFSDEKLGQISINREVYQTNKNRMESLSTQLGRLNAAMPLAKDEESRTQIQTQYKGLLDQYTTLEKENNNIITNLTQGKYESLSDQVPVAPTQDVRPNPTSYLSPESQGQVMGVKNADGTVSKFRQRLNDVYSIFADEESKKLSPGNPLANTELRNVDMSWFENNLNTGPQNQDSIKRTKARIEDGIDAAGNIQQRFNKDRVEKIFSTMDNEIQVPISPTLKRLIGDNMSSTEYAMIFGVSQEAEEDARQYPFAERMMGYDTIKFGTKNDFTTKGLSKGMRGSDGIGTFDAMEKIIKAMPTKAAREAVRKELYSSLTAAAIADTTIGR